MIKSNPQVHSLNMKRAMGLDRALKVAHRCMTETMPFNWGGIPKGTVFYKKDKKGNSSLEEKQLVKLHNYWVHVYHILKKQ